MAISSGSGGSLAGETGLGPRDVLVLSAWYGLAAGWLEVGTRVLARAIRPTGRMYLMSRHFLWLVPLANLALFFGVGLLLAMAMKRWPRGGSWLGPRLLFAAAILPALAIAAPQVATWAWLILAMGLATRLGPRLERAAMLSRRWLIRALPSLLGSVVVVAGLVFGGDWLKQRRESGRPLPPAAVPNVLLVVLDTVRADHLSLYGYPRPTSGTLQRLARRGIRFDEALSGGPPTLAEYLGSRGYATAGFVANVEYCSYDTGLDRGFTHYRDYEVDLAHLRPFRMATLVHWAWEGACNLSLWLVEYAPAARFLPGLKWLVATGRKDAGSINREFLSWLSHRPEPERPFFAFLNYFDAHVPYLPPEGAGFRFGSRPRTLGDFILLDEHFKTIDKARLKPTYRELVGASYDNCLAYLDDRLGELFEALHRRGVLDRTLVIVTADHGEELGGHGLYEHGESLYRPEIRVPLLIVLPSGGRVARVVPETVSLRDLPATVVDLAGLEPGTPFPGRSLARFWRDATPGAGLGADDEEGAISELTAPNPSNPSHGRSPATRGPLVSLAEGDYVYIRNEGDGTEELFHESADPGESTNRAADAAMQPVLERMRRRVDRVKGRSPEAGP
jgi:arylsulfatase A-like enzyme